MLQNDIPISRLPELQTEAHLPTSCKSGMMQMDDLSPRAAWPDPPSAGADDTTTPECPGDPAAPDTQTAVAVAVANDSVASGTGTVAGTTVKAEVSCGPVAQYWAKLDSMRVHKGFATRYIQTLEKFMSRSSADIKVCTNESLKSQMVHRRKIAENVRNYLTHFCQLCVDTPDSSSRPQNIRVLHAIQKTLMAVYKRMGMDCPFRDTSPQAIGSSSALSELEDLNSAVGTSAPTRPPVRAKLSYNTRALTWNSQWSRNAEEKYCYCAENKQDPSVNCTMCKNWFHVSCTTAVPKDDSQFLPFMVNYKFTCAVCSGTESFELRSCSWIESVIGATANLMWTTQRDMFKVSEIGDHLEKHWEVLCFKRQKKDNWRGPLNSYFTNNRDRFFQQKPYWGLADPTPDGWGPQLQPCRLLRCKSAAKPPPSKESVDQSQSQSKHKRTPAVEAICSSIKASSTPSVRTKSGRLVKVKRPTEVEGHTPARQRGARKTRAAENPCTVAWPSTTSAAATQQCIDEIPLADCTEAANLIETTQCGVCGCGERKLGNPARNARICIKCDEEGRPNPKIRKDAYVWQADISSVDGQSIATVFCCKKCHNDVIERGFYDSSSRKARIDSSDFKQTRCIEPLESWAECDFCKQWYHQVCVRWNETLCADCPVSCPNEDCRRKLEAQPGAAKLKQQCEFRARELPETELSHFLEQQLARKAPEPSRDGRIRVRVVSNVPRTGDCSNSFAAKYHGKDLALPFMQKSIFAFYECEDGSDIAFFSLMAQEYGEDCPYPNTNTAYISYLDSNQLYHCRGCECSLDTVGVDCWTKPQQPTPVCTSAADCRRERREVYHIIFLGYLEYLKRRHFDRTYIWVMPPNGGQDYVFYHRPDDMHVPNAKQLETWYINVLDRACEERLITHFEDNTGRRSKHSGKAGSKKLRKPDFMFRPMVTQDPVVAKKLRLESACVGLEPNFESGGSSLRHMPVFQDDSLPSVVERVLKETNTATGSASHRAGVQGKPLRARGAFKRTMSEALVEKVTETMADRRMGSYIVCHFEPEKGSGAPIEGDPVRMVDSDSHAALDTRQSMIRMCTEKQLQFNTVRMGKYSTMVLVAHWLKAAAGEGEAVDLMKTPTAAVHGSAQQPRIGRTASGPWPASAIVDINEAEHSALPIGRTTSGPWRVAGFAPVAEPMMARTSSAGSDDTRMSFSSLEVSLDEMQLDQCDLPPCQTMHLSTSTSEHLAASFASDAIDVEPGDPGDVDLGNKHAPGLPQMDATAKLVQALCPHPDWEIDETAGLAHVARQLAQHVPLERVIGAVDEALSQETGHLLDMMARYVAKTAPAQGKAGYLSSLKELLGARSSLLEDGDRANATRLMMQTAGATAVSEAMLTCVDYLDKQALFSSGLDNF